MMMGTSHSQKERGIPNTAVCLAGLQLSGKAEIMTAAREHGCAVFSTGDSVRYNVSKLFARLNFNNVMQYIESNVREDPLIPIRPLLYEQVRPHCLFIDSIKSPLQICALQDIGYRIITLAIWASPLTRFQRVKLRDRADNPQTMDEFERRDKIELSLGLGEIMIMADFMIDATDRKIASQQVINTILVDF